MTHIILGYKPISTNFQASKYVITVKDPRLHQINVAVLSFLTGPPPTGTQLVELPHQRSAKEEAISSHLVLEEAIKVVEVLDSEEDLEAFNQPQSPESPGSIFSHLPLLKSAASKNLLKSLTQWCYKGSQR